MSEILNPEYGEKKAFLYQLPQYELIKTIETKHNVFYILEEIDHPGNFVRIWMNIKSIKHIDDPFSKDVLSIDGTWKPKR